MQIFKYLFIRNKQILIFNKIHKAVSQNKDTAL